MPPWLIADSFAHDRFLAIFAGVIAWQRFICAICERVIGFVPLIPFWLAIVEPSALVVLLPPMVDPPIDEPLCPIDPDPIPPAEASPCIDPALPVVCADSGTAAIVASAKAAVIILNVIDHLLRPRVTLPK